MLEFDLSINNLYFILMRTLFTVSVKSIIQNAEGKVLFLEKIRNSKKYLDLPGGRIEDDETFEECIKRELKQELSFVQDIKIQSQVGEVWEFPALLFNDEIRRLVVTYNVIAKLDGLRLSEEHEKLLWLDQNDINKIEEKGYIVFDGFKNNLIKFFSR